MFDSSVGGGAELVRGWRITRELMTSKCPGFLVLTPPPGPGKIWCNWSSGKRAGRTSWQTPPRAGLGRGMWSTWALWRGQHSQAKPQTDSNTSVVTTQQPVWQQLFQKQGFKNKNTSSHTYTHYSQDSWLRFRKIYFFYLFTLYLLKILVFNYSLHSVLLWISFRCTAWWSDTYLTCEVIPW